MTCLHLTETSDTDVIVAGSDEQPLAVIRDEVRLHGYRVGPVQSASQGFRFEAQSDEPGKVREFLMGLDDVEVKV